jgi:hypothetical protein
VIGNKIKKRYKERKYFKKRYFKRIKTRYYKKKGIEKKNPLLQERKEIIKQNIVDDITVMRLAIMQIDVLKSLIKQKENRN